MNDCSGSFYEAGPSIPSVSPGTLAWGDYDRDGDLDLVVSGMALNEANERVETTRLLRNDNGSLVDAGIPLPSLSGAAVAFGDFDNDGDLDLVIGGSSKGVAVTYLLWNEANAFVQAEVTLPGLLRGATVAPVDADNDGDLDLLLAPVRFDEPGLAEFGTVVLLNQGDGTFKSQRLSINGQVGFTAALQDFNLDGRLDITIAGGSRWTVALFDSSFGTWLNADELTSITEGQVAVGDYDFDGRPDVIGMGKAIWSGAPDTILFRNARSLPVTEFEAVDAGFVGAWIGSVAFADVDGDGDLDLVQMGLDRSGQAVTSLYLNTPGGSFTKPAIPGQLSYLVTGSSVTLNWQGPGGADTFNVRIGTTPGGLDIVTPMADGSSGRRRLASLGNAGQRRNFRIGRLKLGRYFWSVQSIDAAFNASAFAPEGEFTIGDTPQPLRLSARINHSGQSSLVLDLSGTAGRQVIIQRSTDLQNWEDTGPSVSSDQEMAFDFAIEPKVFYRARVLP